MTTRTCSRRILTAPNVLSMLRIALIPGIVLLLRDGKVAACAALLAVSGATDLVDGWVARHFHCVSDVGKILDPIADKLTVAAVLCALAASHPALWTPLILLVIREVTMGVVGAIAVKRTASVPSARWHGKATTALLYTALFAHILWQDIPSLASNILTACASALMLVSMMLYTADHVRRIRQCKEGET